MLPKGIGWHFMYNEPSVGSWKELNLEISLRLFTSCSVVSKPAVVRDLILNAPQTSQGEVDVDLERAVLCSCEPFCLVAAALAGLGWAAGFSRATFPCDPVEQLCCCNELLLGFCQHSALPHLTSRLDK